MVSALTVLFMGAASVLMDNDVFFFFELFAVVTQYKPEVATRDEVTGVDQARMTIVWLLTVFCIFALVPLPNWADPNPYSPFTVPLGYT